VQRDRRSSATASIVARIGVKTPESHGPAMLSVRSSGQRSTHFETPDFSLIAEKAMQQLDEAHAYTQAIELHDQAQCLKLDPIYPAAIGLTPVQPNKSSAGHLRGQVSKPVVIGDSTKEHMSRLAPSMPQAPSRCNTMDRHPHASYDAVTSKAGRMQAPEYCPVTQQVHFDSSLEPHTFDVPPPATPHPSKGLLNPPRGVSPASSVGCQLDAENSLSDGEHKQVRIVFPSCCLPLYTVCPFHPCCLRVCCVRHIACMHAFVATSSRSS
jgi:hypothetical protein